MRARRPRTRGSPSGDAGSGTGACLTGIYALRGELDVSWEGTDVSGVVILVRPGQGKVVFHARAELEGTARVFPSVFAFCGNELPDFAAGDRVLLDERYSIYVPNETWDQPFITRPKVAWRHECSVPAPGCKIVTQGPFSGTFGAAAFHAPPMPRMFVDHDGDQNPGVTLRVRVAPEKSADGKPYARVPLSFATTARSDTLFAAFHVETTFEGTVTECGKIAGTLRDSRISIRPAGCRSIPEENAEARDCSAAETNFLATNVPTLQVRGGRFEAIRIPDDSDCAAVRAHFDR